MGNMNPSASFKPIVRGAFPNDDVLFVKGAWGGNSIRKWIDAGVKTKHYTQINSFVDAVVSSYTGVTIINLFFIL